MLQEDEDIVFRFLRENDVPFSVMIEVREDNPVQGLAGAEGGIRGRRDSISPAEIDRESTVLVVWNDDVGDPVPV
jgi:hypothetical protein